MKKFILSALFGFLGLFVANSIVALFLLGPMLNAYFGSYVRTNQQGLHIPAILSGYIILAVVMAYLYPKLKWNIGWIKRGLAFGLSMGAAVSLGGHLITAGWSTIPAFPMAVSGVIDALTATVGGVIVAFINNKLASQKMG